MPGTVGLTFPTLVMPQTLCLSFNEAREYAQLRNQYHDGTPEPGQLAQTSRHSFKLSRRLTSSLLAALRAFYESLEGPLQPFIFYNPYDANPVGSNYDPTGVSTTGRYVVAFRNNWSQSTNFLRTDVSNIELVELAVIGPGSLTFSSHGSVEGAVFSMLTSYVPGTYAPHASSGLNSFTSGALIIPSWFSDNNLGNPWTLRVDSVTISPVPLSLSGFWAQFGLTGSVGGSGLAQFLIYDCYISITYVDTTTAVFRPLSASVIPGLGDGGSVLAPNNSIDADPSSPATIQRNLYGGFQVPTILQVNF